MKTIETPAQALQRIENSSNTANYESVIAAFAARGIPIEEIIPRENVLTYKAWLAAGRQVQRRPANVPQGQWGVKIPTIEEITCRKTNKPKKVRTFATVFHISQTDPIGTKTDPQPNPVNPVQTEPNSGPSKSPTDPSPPSTPPISRSSQIGGNSSQIGGHPNKGIAETFRNKADNLETSIQSKLNPAIAKQNKTRRRIGIANSMRDEGRRLQSTQNALRVIADAIDAQCLPESLWRVKTTALVSEILHRYFYENSNERKDLLALIENGHCHLKLDAVADQIQQLEDQLVGQKIPGFFPTPTALANHMAQLAMISAGDEVLEPSAGKGDLADAIRQHGIKNELDIDLTCIEINWQLCDLLTLKGFAAHRADFMSVEGTVDRIIMNPPYEDNTDIRHVLHAYELLKPGGRLVALMGVGAFQRTGRLETIFQQTVRDWECTEQLLSNHLIANAFKGSQSFRQTGVAVRLIVVRKSGVTYKEDEQ